MTHTPEPSPASPRLEVLGDIQAVRDLIPHLARAEDGRLIHAGPYAEQIDVLVIRLLGYGSTLTYVADATGLPFQWVRTVRKRTGMQAGTRWRGTPMGMSPLIPAAQLDAARELTGTCETIREAIARRDLLIAHLAASGWSATSIQPHCDLGDRRIQQIVADHARRTPPDASQPSPDGT